MIADIIVITVFASIAVQTEVAVLISAIEMFFASFIIFRPLFREFFPALSAGTCKLPRARPR